MELLAILSMKAKYSAHASLLIPLLVKSTTVSIFVFFIVPLIKGVSLRLLYAKKNIVSKLIGTGPERVQTDPKEDVQKRTISSEPFGPFRPGQFRISI